MIVLTHGPLRVEDEGANAAATLNGSFWPCLAWLAGLVVRRMEWYYVEAGQRVGPLSEEQFAESLRAGKIIANTLVWKAGMAEWQPYSALAGAPSSGGALALAPLAACAECGRSFPTTEMIAYQGSYVCAACKPVFFQRIREGAPLSGATGLWRSGNTLVMTVGAQLPARCSRCNEVASEPPIRRKLYWHPSWVYIFVLVNIIIYAIVAFAIRKKAAIEVPLCDEHRKRRWMFIAASWLMVLLSIAMLFVAINGRDGTAAGLASIGLFFAGVILGVWKGTLVRAKKIDDRYVWVSGCGPAFLSSLPEWHGPG